LTSSIIQYVIFLVTTGGILPIVDRVGRRPLLLGGAIVCCILHFATGAIMATSGHYVDSVGGIFGFFVRLETFNCSLVQGNSILRWKISDAPAKGVIALCYIFVGVYGLTWAPIGWIYCSEVFPLKYRANGAGLSAASN
jgi:MFS family permease